MTIDARLHGHERVRRKGPGRSRERSRHSFRLTLLSSLSSLACVLVLSLVGGHLAVEATTSYLLRTEAERISSHVRMEFMEGAVESIWEEPSSRESVAFFERFAEFIQGVERARKIKIWDVGGKIVWSTDEKLTGTVWADENVSLALAGTLVSNWHEPGHSSLEREEFQNLFILETHIPIWRKAGREGGRADLVLELYIDAERYLKHLQSVRNYLWLMAGSGGLVVYLIMLGAVRLSGRRLAKAAGRNQALYLESARIAERLEITDEISKAVGSMLVPEELFRVIIREIRRAVPCERCLIASIDSESREYLIWRIESDVGLEPPPEAYGLDVWWSPKVYGEGRTEIVADLRDVSHPWARRMVDAGLRSQVVIPILRDGQCIAHLTLSSIRESAFSDEHVKLLASVASHLGSAIRNATLFRAAERRAARLAVLNELTRKITEKLTLSEVRDHIVRAVAELLKGDCARIFLIDEASGLLTLKTSCCLVPGAKGRTPSFQLGEPVTGKVAQTGEAAVVADMQEVAHPKSARWAEEFGFHASIDVPLYERGSVAGVINCLSRKKNFFTQEDLDLLGALASQATIAMENARLHEQIQSMALIEERHRIAREMHDGIAQDLGFLYTKFGQLELTLKSKQQVESLVELKRMKEVVREAYEEVRQSIVGLRSLSSRGPALVPALGEYLEHFQDRTGIAIELQMEDEVAAQFSPRVDAQLIRIVQEALANVRKHAKAKRIWVTFSAEEMSVRVRIRDDGVGFDLEAHRRSRQPSFGLETMRERAEEVGGTFTITTAPGQGCTVEVQLPLP